MTEVLNWQIIDFVQTRDTSCPDSIDFLLLMHWRRSVLLQCIYDGKSAIRSGRRGPAHVFGGTYMVFTLASTSMLCVK